MKGIEERNPICAVCTPSGMGAIAVIRVSGERSIEIVDSIFEPVSKKSRLSDLPGYSVKFGYIYETAASGEREILDEVLVSVFRSPHSYTGEDCVEIACHGSEYIQQEIILLLISNGVRTAGPGEFSQRAFLNGKMDLAQAEAVADLISSENYASHKIAMQQMKGGFSSELKEMRADLLKLVSLMELELDFSEEDVEFADRKQLKALQEKITDHIALLMESFKTGNAIKNGIPVAIVGATNTGKSTLLNALLGEERAIVSNIHGTTRDTIEDCMTMGGVKFRFIDTAGIRSTDEVIEMIGIERTYTKIAQASVIILMLDSDRPEYFDDGILSLKEKMNLSEQKLVVVLNKIDSLVKEDMGKLIGKMNTDSALQQYAVPERAPIASHPLIQTQLRQIQEILDKAGMSAEAIIPMAAKPKVGLDLLKDLLVKDYGNVKVSGNATMVTNIRHYEALADAYNALGRVAIGLDDGLPTDLVAEDIREALFHIGSIVGEINTSEILNTIFGQFCVGK